MLASLLCEVRIWPALWRRRLVDFRFIRHKEQLGFVGVLALLLLGMAGIIYWAWLDGTRIEPARIEALQLAETRQQQRADELECLAENVYFEARGEPLQGQYAVAEVTVNRTHARHFPRTVCAVVHETRWDPARQRHVADFSWTQQGPLSPEDGPAWKQALAVASAVYDDVHPPVVPDALFYHAVSVQPEWSRNRHAVARIGNHVFYR